MWMYTVLWIMLWLLSYHTQCTSQHTVSFPQYWPLSVSCRPSANQNAHRRKLGKYNIWVIGVGWQKIWWSPNRDWFQSKLAEWRDLILVPLTRKIGKYYHPSTDIYYLYMSIKTYIYLRKHKAQIHTNYNKKSRFQLTKATINNEVTLEYLCECKWQNVVA